MKNDVIRRRFSYDGITGWAHFFILFGLAHVVALFLKLFVLGEDDAVGAVVIAVLVVILEAVGVALLRRSKARHRMERELRESGSRAVATITGCVDTGVRVGGSKHGSGGTRLYRILCSCTIDHRPRQFESRSLYGNPMGYLTDNRVIVYYDREDTSRYFVDVDESIAEFYVPEAEPKESIPFKWKLALLITVLAAVVRHFAGSAITSPVDLVPLPFFFIFVSWLCNARWELRENRHPLVLHMLMAVGLAVVSFVFPPAWRESTAYFGAVFLAFATLPINFIVSFCSQENRKRRRCKVQTTAVLVGHRQGTLQTTATFFPIFSYDAAGETKEVAYNTGLPRPLKEHTTVEILYNEKNPEEFCFLDQWREPSNKVVSGLVVAVAFVLGVILLVMIMS